MIILASASPRRQELLSLICENFIVIPADIDESVNESISIEKYPEYLANKKAEHIFNNHDNDIVIGCDTGVFIDGKMLGKPLNNDDAKNMLKQLSGKTHKVITGCCVLAKDKCIRFSQVTEVKFFELTDIEIDEYIATGEPMDKAGGYGIQGKGATLVSCINGDYFNVVGLPVSTLNRKLRDLLI